MLSRSFNRHLLPAFAVFLAAVVSVAPPALAQDAEARQDKVRAAMIYNFARFTRWPAEAFSQTDGTINFCISSTAPLSASLAALEGKAVGAKKIAVVEASSAIRFDANCHLVVVTPDLIDYVAQASHANTLYVSTGEDAHTAQTSIELVEVGRQTRFAVAPGVAKSNGVEISSKLIDLAIWVR